MTIGKRGLSREEDDDVIGFGHVGNVKDGLRRRNGPRVRPHQLTGENQAEHSAVLSLSNCLYTSGATNWTKIKRLETFYFNNVISNNDIDRCQHS